MANREIFGEDKHDNSEQTEELELAYQIEKLRELESGGDVEDLPLFLLLNGVEVAGIIDQKDYLVVAPSGRGTQGRKIAEVRITYVGSKTEKMDVNGGEVEIVDLDPTRSLKIQVNFGADFRVDKKSSMSWSGAGKKLLVVDVRGRPLPELHVSVKQQEMIKKMRAKL